MSDHDRRWLWQKRRNPRGISMRDCQKAWRMLGGLFWPVRRTGETRYVHANLPQPITVGRGKDGPRSLLRAIVRLIDRALGE